MKVVPTTDILVTKATSAKQGLWPGLYLPLSAKQILQPACSSV